LWPDPLVGFDKEVKVLTHKKNLKKLRSKDLVAVCSWCLKIRDLSGDWIDPGMLFFRSFGGKFTHTICEQCSKLYFPEFERRIFEPQQQIDPDDLQPIKAPMVVIRGH
jgi:hypothetical protein